MILYFRWLFALILLIGSALSLTDCRSKSTDSQQETYIDTDQSSAAQSDTTSRNHRRGKHHHSKHHRQQEDGLSGRMQPDQRTQLDQKEAIPSKVFDVLSYVLKNGQAMDGYVGGRQFGNFENKLPKSDVSGRPIQYWEWDVNPKTQGRNRGVERLITSSDNRAYYTSDHYNSFTEVK